MRAHGRENGPSPISFLKLSHEFLQLLLLPLIVTSIHRVLFALAFGTVCWYRGNSGTLIYIWGVLVLLVGETMDARMPVSSSSSSSSSSSTTSSASTVPSIVSELPELFRREPSQFSSSGGIFDSVFPSGSNKAVRREVSISESSFSWKKQQPEYKIWNAKQKSADGIYQAAERDGRNISSKDGASGCTGELVEHTLLSSSVHYGGRDNFESSTTTTYTGTPTIFGNNGGEDVSDGGSPRGNWWQGSYYY